MGSLDGPKRIYVLGAGASFGCGPTTPHQLPLGKDLFDRLAAYSGLWASLEPEVAAEFCREDVPFEPGFAVLEKERSGHLLAFLREMACYFLEFRPGEGNLYAKFVRRTLRQRGQAIFATLNYDLLLDDALNAASGGRMEYLVRPKQRLRPTLLRLHGAPQLIPDIPPGFLHDVEIWDAPSGAAAVPMRLASAEEALAYWRSDTSLGPTMSLYAPGKRVLVTPDAVTQVQENFAAQVAEADTIVVIGCRYVPGDEHVWDPIAAAKEVVLVDPGENVGADLAARRRNLVTRHEPLTFKEWLAKPLLF